MHTEQECGVVIRGAVWKVIQSRKGLYLRNQFYYLKSEELTPDEQIAMQEAWIKHENLKFAEALKKEREAQAKLKARQRYEDEQVALGQAIILRRDLWYVSSNMVWKHEPVGKGFKTTEMRLSELSDWEMSEFIEAHKIQERNRGASGIVRKFWRRASVALDF